MTTVKLQISKTHCSDAPAASGILMYTQNFWALTHKPSSVDALVKRTDEEGDTYWFERLVSAALCHGENFELSRHDSGWVVQKLEVGFRLLFLFFFILLFSLILWKGRRTST